MDPYSVNPISSDNEPASRMASVVAGGTEQDQRFEIGRRIEGQIEGLSRACTATDDGHDRSAEIHATPTDLRAAQDLEKTCDGLQDPPRDACLRRSEPGADTQETLPATVLSATESSNIVDWDGPDDPESPLNWSPTRKWTTIVLVSSITFNVSVLRQPLSMVLIQTPAPWLLPFSPLVCLRPWRNSTSTVPQLHHCSSLSSSSAWP